MKVQSKEITLKNNKTLILRNCDYDDAQAFLDFFRQSTSETENLVRYPEEIIITPEKEGQILDRIMNSEDQWSIGVFDGKRIVGNINFGSIGNRIKIRHRITFGITILKEYWNLGLGSILIQEMLDVLKENEYEQVELEVLSCNSNAIQLYKKFGFEEYGRIPHGIKFKNGEYMDLISMIKFLKEY